MTLTNTQLQEIYCGAYSFAETPDGYLQSYQYSDAQMEYFKGAFDFWYDRCMASTSKTLEFTTTATKLSFEYKTVWIGSLDSVELEINGLVTEIKYMKDLEKEGKITFAMPEGNKQVTVYLPADATMYIKNLNIDAAYSPIKKEEKVLWLGDSITQGYGPLRSGQTYVCVANRLLHYDIINQGIGGYVYDKKVLMPMEGYKPDKIIVALGTNQYGSETMIDIEEYHEILHKIYGDTPVLCITPIWRGDSLEHLDKLISFCQGIADVCKKYPNIKVVNGFELVPHMSEYYLDNLHPNTLGCEVYGRNLVAKIKEIGF